MNQYTKDIYIATLLISYLQNEKDKNSYIEELMFDNEYAGLVDEVLLNHWRSFTPATSSHKKQAEVWRHIQKKAGLKSASHWSLKFGIKKVSYSVAAILALSVGIYLFLSLEEPALAETPMLTKIEKKEKVELVKQVASPQDTARMVLPDAMKAPVSRLPIAALEVVASSEPKVQDPVPEKRVKYTTETGEYLDLLLADGTLIKVYENTQISFPESFSDSLREVTLSGRASFQVAHRSASVFSITTPDFLVEVLGTDFELRSYDTEQESMVFLERGSVRVSLQDGTRYQLTPNQRLLFDKADQTVSVLKEGVKGLNKKKSKKNR